MDALKRAGIRPLRFHDLRHTFGSIAINQATIAAIEQALREGMTTAAQLRRAAAGADRRVADLIDRSLRAQPSGA